MASEPKANLLALLPAGEWQNVQILNRPHGMMASHNWAVFAKARWLRHGGKDAFIKFIVSASASAGADTNFVTSEARLKLLEKRLSAVQRLGAAVPLVPLLEVRLTEHGLLIAMEEVRPLQDVIERGEAYHLSSRVLRDLDPDSHTPAEWFHYDICPRNVGVTTTGASVFIDVESFYLADGPQFAVSVPAWKSFRVPRALRDEIDELQARGAVPAEAALRKIRFEVALAAAECMLGPMPTDAGHLDESRVGRWISGADANDSGVAFWGRELRRLVAGGVLPPLSDLAERLDETLSSNRSSTHAPRAGTTHAEGVVREPPQHVSPEASITLSGWEMEWAMLSPAAHALRSGRLDEAGLVAYRTALERLARKHPSQRQVWMELLLVLITYLKDRDAAWQVAQAAVQTLPEDQELERFLHIVRLWAGEQKQ